MVALIQLVQCTWRLCWPLCCHLAAQSDTAAAAEATQQQPNFANQSHELSNTTAWHLTVHMAGNEQAVQAACMQRLCVKHYLQRSTSQRQHADPVVITPTPKTLSDCQDQQGICSRYHKLSGWLLAKQQPSPEWCQQQQQQQQQRPARPAAS
jgi:hypothetical protein